MTGFVCGTWGSLWMQVTQGGPRVERKPRKYSTGTSSCFSPQVGHSPSGIVFFFASIRNVFSLIYSSL